MEELFSSSYTNNINGISEVYKIINLIKSDISKKSWKQIQAYYLGECGNTKFPDVLEVDKTNYYNLKGMVLLDRDVRWSDKYTDEKIRIEYSIPIMMAAAIMDDKDLLIETRKRYGNSILAGNGPVLSVIIGNRIPAFGGDNSCIYEVYNMNLLTYILFPVELEGKAAHDIVTDIIVNEYRNSNKRDQDVAREMIKRAINLLDYTELKEKAALQVKNEMPDIYNDIIDDIIEYVSSIYDMNNVFIVVKDCLFEAVSRYEKKADEVIKNVGKEKISAAKIKSDMYILENIYADILLNNTLYYNKRLGQLKELNSKVFSDTPWLNDEEVSIVINKQNIALQKEIVKEKIKIFDEEIEEIRHGLKPVQYFRILNRLWENNLEAYSRKSGSMNNCMAVSKRECDLYEQRIKGFIKELDNNIDVKKEFIKMCVDDKTVISQSFITRLLFYKNKISPQGSIFIDIQDYKKITGLLRPRVGIQGGVCHHFGVGEWDEFEIPDEDDYLERVEKVWKESSVTIKRPKNLYGFQKKILTECSEDMLLKAFKAGFFPKEVGDKALEYVRKEGLNKAVPLMTVLAYK